MFDLRFQLEVLSSEALLGDQVCLESTAATFKEDGHGGFLWTIKDKSCLNFLVFDHFFPFYEYLPGLLFTSQSAPVRPAGPGMG